MAGISNPYLSQIERGLRKPSAEILQQIAAALRISAETLYVRAGILDEPGGATDLIAEIRRDRATSTRSRSRRSCRSTDRSVASGPPAEPDGSDEALEPDGATTGGGHADGEESPGASERWSRSVRTLAVLSLHTSPLVQPGAGDSGGMNVYVRELVGVAGPGRRRVPGLRAALAPTTCPTWSTSSRLPGRPRRRRAGRPAQGGAARRSSTSSPTACASHLADAARPTLIHANYWLSGVAGHRLKHELDLPLVSTFHTLARVKAETGDPEPQRRIEAEAEVIGCSDAITASLPGRGRPARAALRRRPRPHRDRAAGRRPRLLLARATARGARRALGLLGDAPGAAVRRADPAAQGARRRGRRAGRAASHAARRPCWWSSAARAGRTATPSSPRCTPLADDLGVADRVRFVAAAAPPPALDVLPGRRRVLVPSRSESFGWSRSRPRRAARRSWRPRSAGSLVVVDGETGFLVEGRDPHDYAAAASKRPGRPGRAAAALASARPRHARGYTWSITAARLRRLYADLTQRARRVQLTFLADGRRAAGSGGQPSWRERSVAAVTASRKAARTPACSSARRPGRGGAAR